MSHPNGYTKEMVKEILGSSWPTVDPNHETGNQMRRRKGQEMRAGKRPYPKYPSAESRAKLPNFDENGKYIYPENAGFRYTEWLRDNPNSAEASVYGSKVS